MRFGAEEVKARRGVLTLLCAFAFALVALAAMPNGANAAFSVSGFQYTNSTNQAGAHPNTTIAFNRNGSESEDLRDVLLDLPTGVFPNPESAGVTKCTEAQFNADSCPNATQVGTITANIKALSLLNITAPGSIDIITPRSNEVATLGMTLRPPKICILFVFCAVPQKVFLKTGVVVRTYEDSGIRTYTPGTPRTTSIAIPLIVATPTMSADITMNKLTLAFQSRANSSNNGPYFWYNSTSCVPAPAKVTITSYQNVSSSAQVNNSPTGCTNVPFNPTFSYAPGVTNSQVATTAQYVLNIPDGDATIQNALPKLVDVDFPLGSGLDLNNLAGIQTCTETQLQAQACPASSIIGNAQALSKFLPPSLQGNVYAMGNGGPVGLELPIGVQLIGPRNTVVIFRGTLLPRGDANEGTGRVGALFDRIPQLPFKKFTLNITSNIYKNPATCGPAVTTSKIYGFNGTTSSSGQLGTLKTQTSSYNVTDCAPAPETTITSGPPEITTNRQPEIAFESSIPDGAVFRCSLDGEAPALCESPYMPPLPLDDGVHTFSVTAFNGLTPDPTPATYSFEVATGSSFTIDPSITTTTTQAAANPNLHAEVDVAGGQPQSLAIQFPKGFNASLNGRPLCDSFTAFAGNCAPETRMGSLQITANTFSGPVTGTGDVFLTDAPSGGDAGGAAVKVELPGVGTFIAQGGANLVNNGNNQNLEIRDFPTNIDGTDITITRLVMDIDGNVNRLLTNPSTCDASQFTVNMNAFDGSVASPVEIPYQATNCAAVPFNPTLQQDLSNPVAAGLTGVAATVTTQPGDSAIKTLKVVEPPSLAPNFPAFGEAEDQCAAEAATNPDSIFDESTCPQQAIVGFMYIETPLLPYPLVGDVFLINKNPLPWFGVKIDYPGINLRLTGVTSTPQVDPACNPLTAPSGFCQTQISAVFNNLPDVPLSLVYFVLDGPDRTGVNGPLSGQILRVASPGQAACASGPAKSTITPFANPSSPANLTQTITVSGC